jgi:hypothetical protein
MGRGFKLHPNSGPEIERAQMVLIFDAWRYLCYPKPMQPKHLVMGTLLIVGLITWIATSGFGLLRKVTSQKGVISIALSSNSSSTSPIGVNNSNDATTSAGHDILQIKAVGQEVSNESTQTEPAFSTATAAESTSVSWNEYRSTESGVSFEYPAGWIVTDNQLVLPAVSSATALKFSALWICPPPSQIIGGEKEGLNNCILFYTETDILHGGEFGFEDVSTLFTDFSRYIQDSSNTWDNFRVLEQQSPTETSTELDLVGLYRERQNFVGVSQALCNEGYSECLLRFKHILDSIQLFAL